MLRRADELVMAAAPGFDRWLFPVGSGAMLGYGLMPYEPTSTEGATEWPRPALRLQKQHLPLYVCAVVEPQRGERLLGPSAARALGP